MKTTTRRTDGAVLAIIVLLVLAFAVTGIKALLRGPVRAVSIEGHGAVSSPVLEVGDTLQLAAEGETRGGQAASEAQLEKLHLRWASSRSDVATVDGGGLVTAVAPGSVNITVASGDGSVSARPVTLTVVETPDEKNR